MNEITIIYIAIGVLYIVCFFVLCYNVGIIKKTLKGKRSDVDYLRDFYKFYSFGDNEKAKEHLLAFVWNLMKENQLAVLPHREEKGYEKAVENKKNDYNKYKNKYTHLFQLIDEPFPKFLELPREEAERISYNK